LANYPALPFKIEYPLYARLIFALQFLECVLFWLAAAWIYIRVGLQNGRHAPMGLYSALLLALLPLLLLLWNSGDLTRLPSPWEEILTAAGSLLFLLGISMLVLFYYIFPDGGTVPRWSRPVGLVFASGSAIVLALLASERVEGEWLWPAFIILLLAALLAGVSSLIYRSTRLARPGERFRAGWVVLALALQPILFLAGSQPVSSLVPALLPLALLWELRGGLWNADGPVQSRLPLRLAAFLGLILAAGLALALAWSLPAPAQDLAFDPLPAAASPRPVVIDTDMAPDDLIAILYLLQRPEVRVLAITVTGTGEAHCEPGVSNALGLVALAGENAIPVACGRETPLQGNAAFPDPLRERSDSLLGLSLPEGENPAAGRSAPELLHSTILDSPEPVTLVTLGPLTNLAEALQEDPTFLDNLAQIYIMGGALETLGNVGFFGIENQVAEWNIYVDPLALQIVLDAGAPVTLVPLDATDDVPVRPEFFLELGANRRTPEAAFVYELLSTQLASIANGEYQFWDPLTAALAVDESLGYIRAGRVKVYTNPGPSSGLTRLNPGGAPARFARAVPDPQRFELELLRTLNQP
jgi:inosine-uridine nucleoside N-ribohydrolase